MSRHDAAGPAWARLLVVLVSRAYRAMLLTLAVIAAAPLLAGWGSYVVASDSMRPTIAVGDVVLARPTADDHKVRVGRVYVFDDPTRAGRLLVHRVVERRDDGDFTTAGDANDVTDLTPLKASGIRAQAILLVPYVGLPVHWARTGDWVKLFAWLLLSSAAFALAMLRVDPRNPAQPRPSPKRRGQVAVATAVAVGAVAAGTTGAAGAAFTDRTTNSGNEWTAGAWLQPYVGAVMADKPFGFWLLDESSGIPYAQDRSGNNQQGEYYQPVTLAGPGALPNNPGTSLGVHGGRVVLGTNPTLAPNAYSVELWFRTTSTAGGYVAGFQDDRDTGWKATADRIITLQPTGQITFGAWENYKPGMSTPRAYNDGQWHHLVVTSTATRTSTIYIDGQAVIGGVTAPVSTYPGYWRVGQGRIGPGQQVGSFPGDLDNVAIYHTVLPATRVAAHYAAR